MSILAAAAVAAGVASVQGYIFYQGRRIARDPHRYPELKTRARPPWLLRIGHFDTQAGRLTERGFVELGTMVEALGGFRVASRVFYDPSQTTYAGLYSRVGVASLSFITELADGRIVYTGNARAPLVRYGRLYEQGLAATLTRKLQAHRGLLQRVRDRPRDATTVPEPIDEPMGTMNHRLALTRRYYIERFSAPPNQAPSTF